MSTGSHSNEERVSVKEDYIKSSPRFFRLIERSFLAAFAALIILAASVPAPLQEPADPAHVPNPVKSGWFLLWIQELVSYDKNLIHLVIAAGLLLLFLPWLVRGDKRHARWFERDLRLLHGVAALAVLWILALTIVAAFFRGQNWAFVF